MSEEEGGYTIINTIINTIIVNKLTYAHGHEK